VATKNRELVPKRLAAFVHCAKACSILQILPGSQIPTPWPLEEEKKKCCMLLFAQPKKRHATWTQAL
jgi:hypothetical protein